MIVYHKDSTGTDTVPVPVFLRQRAAPASIDLKAGSARLY